MNNNKTNLQTILKSKTFKRSFAAILAGLLVLGFLQRLLVPKYVDGIIEGNFVQEYYKEEDKDFDVVFVGDCEVYENFSPVYLWENYGINSYIRGSAEQYIMQSYYLAEDTFRYHKPQVLIFNIQSLQFDKAQKEAYNRMSIEGMKWSSSKIGAIKSSMTEEEHFLDYVFPILRYHSRWNEIGPGDFKYFFSTPNVSYNGYYMRLDVKAADNIPDPKNLMDYRFGENAWKYLDMMRELCNNNGVKLLLIKAPSLYPYWYPQWDEQVAEYAEKYGLDYINFLDIKDEIGIDYSTDTYDGGLHMNLSGAEKLSAYIGDYLINYCNVSDRRSDAKLSSVWDKEIKAYYEEMERQKELYGIK